MTTALLGISRQVRWDYRDQAFKKRRSLASVGYEGIAVSHDRSSCPNAKELHVARK
jgi:hypothetical protein